MKKRLDFIVKVISVLLILIASTQASAEYDVSIYDVPGKSNQVKIEVIYNGKEYSTLVKKDKLDKFDTKKYIKFILDKDTKR